MEEPQVPFIGPILDLSSRKGRGQPLLLSSPPAPGPFLQPGRKARNMDNGLLGLTHLLTLVGGCNDPVL